MNFDENRALFNSFMASKFSYCPLNWMCHTRGINNKMNQLLERALKTSYKDKMSDLKTLLKNGMSVLFI